MCHLGIDTKKNGARKSSKPWILHAQAAHLSSWPILPLWWRQFIFFLVSNDYLFKETCSVFPYLYFLVAKRLSSGGEERGRHIADKSKANLLSINCGCSIKMQSPSPVVSKADPAASHCAIQWQVEEGCLLYACTFSYRLCNRSVARSIVSAVSMGPWL